MSVPQLKAWLPHLLNAAASELGGPSVATAEAALQDGTAENDKLPVMEHTSLYVSTCKTSAGLLSSFLFVSLLYAFVLLLLLLLALRIPSQNFAFCMNYFCDLAKLI